MLLEINQKIMGGSWEKFTFKEFIQKYRDKRSDEIIAYELYLIIYETYLINEKLDKIMELINDEGD